VTNFREDRNSALVAVPSSIEAQRSRLRQVLQISDAGECDWHAEPKTPEVPQATELCQTGVGNSGAIDLKDLQLVEASNLSHEGIVGTVQVSDLRDFLKVARPQDSP
jgi:hypothetical protein